MLATLNEELVNRSIGTVLALLIGGAVGWFYGRWKRSRQKRSVFTGDARDIVSIQHHIIETIPDATMPSGQRITAVRVRTLGQAQLEIVVPNAHLAAVLWTRAAQVSMTMPMISMVGAEGSFLLETLSGFCGDRLGQGPFEHNLYVMAPCCEPEELAKHQPIVIMLVALKHLGLFEHWEAFKDVQVEHGSDGARVLTLLMMARKFREEQDTMGRMKHEGRRRRHVETMYVLDLPLDLRTASLPLKPVPWQRFDDLFKRLGIAR